MLFCILGNSGVGKDTIVDLVEAQWDGYVKRLPMITDRPCRVSEKNDPNNYYEFVSSSYFKDNIPKLVEMRIYEVTGGSFWNYGTRKSLFDDAINDTAHHYITTCTPYQFSAYFNYLPAEKRNRLFPLLVTMSSEKERLKRMLERVDDNDVYGIREVCRRFGQDKEYIYVPRNPNHDFVFCNDSEEDLTYIVNYICNIIRIDDSTELKPAQDAALSELMSDLNAMKRICENFTLYSLLKEED